MPNNWTPPSDAQVTSNKSNWTPPADAVTPKKKESTSKDSHFYTEAVKEAGLPVTDQKKVQKPSVSSGSKTIDSKQAEIDRVKAAYPDLYTKTKVVQVDREKQKVIDQVSQLEKEIAVEKEKIAAEKQIQLKKDIDEMTINSEMTDAEMAKVFGWSEEEVRKAKAGVPTKNIPYAPAMAKPKEAEQIIKDVKKAEVYKNIWKEEQAVKDEIYNNVDYFINSSLISQEEEEVVQQLRNKFSGSGFIFEESGLGDYVTVKFTPDGMTTSKEIEIPLDYGDSSGLNEANAVKLREFMKNAYMTKSEWKKFSPTESEISGDKYEGGETQWMLRASEMMAKNPEKYGEQLIDKEHQDNVLGKYAISINQEYKWLEDEYSSLKKQIDAYNQNPTDNERIAINNKIHDLAVREYNLNDKASKLATVNKNWGKAAASYAIEKSKNGSLLGQLGAQFASGFGSMGKAATNISMEIGASLIDTKDLTDASTYQNYKNAGYTDDQIAEQIVKDAKRTFMPALEDAYYRIGSAGSTTKEYIQSEDRSTIENVLGSLAESLGTAMSGGGNPGLQRLAFFAQSYNSMSEQMRGKEFDGLSESDKMLISVPFGLAIGALEKFGYDATIGLSKSGIFNKTVNNIIRKSITDLPKDASLAEIKREINKNVSNLVKSGAIKIVAGSITEGNVEGIQSLTEVGTKNIVNELYGKDLFQNVPDITTKDGILEAIEMASNDAALGALGGLIMSGGSISSQTYKQAKFNETTDYNFDTFYSTLMDENLRSSLKYNTKIKLQNGEITKEQAQEEIDSINKNTGILNSIPVELSIRDKKDSFNLILERDKLQSEIKGKDEALVSAQKERINAINEELKTISQNATKENNIEQQEGGTVEYQGTDEGQQEVGQTAQPEADTSNSTVEVTPAFKETEDVNLYSQSLEAARAEMKKAGKGDDLQVSPVSPEEAQAIIDEGGKIFISEDGKYGGYVKADGYMGGLFKDPNMKYKGVSKLLQDARVKEGGRFMEGFATYLEKEYVKNGFRPVARLKFNEEYAPEGWDAPNSSLRTKPDVVFFAYDPTGKYEVGEGEYFDDYDQAYETAKNYGIDTKAANAESIEQMLQSEEYADVDTKLLKAARLVSKALPKTKIYLHKTTDAYNDGIARAAGMTKEQVANEEGQSSGEYVNGEIHINLEIADDTTVFHEAFHDIFIKKAFTSGAAIDMANGLRRIISDKQLIEKLDKFISNYESAEQSEEFLAELTGIISAAETELSTTKLHAFKQLINEIAKKLGLPAIFGSTASRQDVLDFINTMSRKLRTGEKIEDGGGGNTRKKRISPENSSNYANLTEDGKGNFVFYHVGGNNFKTIKRGSGGTLATSRGEANAIGKVGGIAQYYTRPEDGESMVSGPSKYIVKVDQAKVYDFNTDLDNLFEQAKERFESEYPGLAFDANTQLAYVTKIANEQGYDMVVADWNGKTRAQTTIEFSPDDVQVSNGNTIVQPFKENYISNTANGYESVIPESKISKLEKLFDKIYKVRNAESKYDALYSLGQDYGKMSTEEISSLILNSDLSEEIKNEYNDIMSYVPPVRSSRKKRKAPTVEQQIAKAVRDSKMDFKNKQRAIAAIVKEMRKSGKINTKQAAIIVERFSKLNVDNPITVGKYLDYVGKLMNDADYDQKLKDARSLRSKIKRLKNAQATVVAMGKKFTSIDPSMIDDFESYMDIGDKVYNALKPTRSNGGDPSYRMATVIGEINEYSDKVLSDIEEKVKNDLLETYKGLVDAGIINSEMTLKELQAEIKKMDENPEHVTDFDSDIREINKEMFKSLSETIEMDQFTPEEQKLIKEFMAMDLEKMNVRDGYAAVEAMDNLRLNGILDGVQAMVYKYKGVIGAAQLKDADIKTRDLKLYFSKLLGRNITNLSANLKVLADSIFMGVKAGGEVLSKMGINAFESGIAKATQEYRREVDKYGEMFHKTKPNGESFHTSRNAFERGFYATLKRTVIGSESEQKAEFKRKIGLIKESIETLSKGSKEEKKKSEIYQELYNKLGLEKAESILDVETKIDKINRDAVNHTIDMWSKYYQQLSDVSLSVYNSMLKADLNYTPDKFSRLTRNVMSASEAEALISKNGSFASTIGFTDKSKSGVLMESTKPNLVDGRFIDLDFDMNNFSALKAALIDINTAGPVRQIEGFLKSRDYQSLISSAEDMKLFTKRVNNYVMRAKGKEMIDNDSWKDLNKTLNVVSTFGTSKSLGSIFQPIKQVVPVALNTMVNAKTANLNISESMSADFNQWYKENGISTSNRGAESTSAIETAEKYLDKQPDSKIGKAGEYLSKANEFWIKMFLARPDIFIARASWLTYYKQSLKEQGLDTDIDWMTHEKNEQAADFATHNIDRQQNVSDTAMAGELFASSNSLMKIVKNVAFPFASFSMNQKQRMYSDIRTFIDKNATEEDKSLAKSSIMGLTAEMITYQAIGWSIRYFIYKSIAEAITGDKSDDDDEERDWKNALQYTIGSVVKDFFSIAPPLDGATLSGFDYLMKNIQDWSDFGSNDADEAVKATNIKREERGEEPMTKDQEAKFRSNLFDENRWEFKDYDSGMVNLGTYTILKDKISEAYKLEEIVRTGKVVEETQWGVKEKYLLPEDVSKLKAMIALDVAFLTGALPTDVHSVSKKVQTLVKRRALTEVQMEKYKEIKKEYGNVPDYVLGIIKDTRKEVPKIIEEMEWIKREGGLTKDQEKKYMSIMKKNGEVTVGDLRKIKSGS